MEHTKSINSIIEIADSPEPKKVIPQTQTETILSPPAIVSAFIFLRTSKESSKNYGVQTSIDINKACTE